MNYKRWIMNINYVLIRNLNPKKINPNLNLNLKLDGDDYGEEDGSMETAGNGVSESEFEEHETQYEDQEFI